MTKLAMLGNVGSPRERGEALQKSIIAFLEGDHATRIWWGAGKGVDFLAVEVKAKDGSRWFMGRMRYLKDNVLFGSDDEKEGVACACGPEVSDYEWRKLAWCYTAAALIDGVLPEEHAIDARTPEELMEAMRKVVTDHGGRCASMTVTPKKEPGQ